MVWGFSKCSGTIFSTVQVYYYLCTSLVVHVRLCIRDRHVTMQIYFSFSIDTTIVQCEKNEYLRISYIFSHKSIFTKWLKYTFLNLNISMEFYLTLKFTSCLNLIFLNFIFSLQFLFNYFFFWKFQALHFYFNTSNRNDPTSIFKFSIFEPSISHILYDY